jgi:hypothetical protein
MLRLLLLWLPGHVDTGRLQQTAHKLVTNTARQTVNVRLYIVAIKAHHDHRFTLKARMLTELLRHVGGKVSVHPVLQRRLAVVYKAQWILAAAGSQQQGQ